MYDLHFQLNYPYILRETWFMSEDNILIAAKLKELRKAHGYTQDFVAANIDVKQPTYQQYESGKRKPSTTSLYKLANFYGLTTDELLKLCIPLDKEIYFDAPETTIRTLEEAELTSYGSSEKFKKFSAWEIQMLFYFSKLSETSQKELIEYAKFKIEQEKK